MVVMFLDSYVHRPLGNRGAWLSEYADIISSSITTILLLLQIMYWLSILPMETLEVVAKNLGYRDLKNLAE